MLLTVDFKKRKLGDVRAHDFVDDSISEIKSFDHVIKMMT